MTEQIELRDYKKKVYKIMEQHESARNNDGSLIAYFIKYHCPQIITHTKDGELAILLSNLKYLPPFNSIRVARQAIQNINGVLLPTDPAVIKARRIKEKNIHDVEYREMVNS
jgi:hypothetical protein